jgi:hypothetical protein
MQTTHNFTADFYCGVCMAPFTTREAREAHKLQVHAEHYETLEQSLATPLAERLAGSGRTIEFEAPAPSYGNGKPKAKVPTGKASYTADEVVALVESLGRKFEAEDMDSGLVKFAQAWLDAYAGDFAFLLDLRNKGKRLTPGQAKGVLNCYRADHFRNKPKATPAPSGKSTTALPEVPAGRYALDTQEGATNATAFYRVDRPTKGKWEGYTFVKRLVSDNEERVPFAQTASILQRIIDAGTEEAGLRYGREIGKCCRCNRTLTNDESRQLGIGPECRNKA